MLSTPGVKTAFFLGDLKRQSTTCPDAEQHTQPYSCQILPGSATDPQWCWPAGWSVLGLYVYADLPGTLPIRPHGPFLGCYADPQPGKIKLMFKTGSAASQSPRV